MDHETFDRLARALGTIGTRRAALGAVLGGSLAGTLAADAAKKDRKKRRSGKGDKNSAQVTAQAADCLSPGPSSNMNGCPFQGSDFSDDDLSGSSMVGTNFNVSALVGTNLSSSNMKAATFRGANLMCADLSSSTLRNADFRGFPVSGPNLGPPTDLTGADLSSSGGCGTVLTNTRTILCGTTWCDGSVRNDSCPDGTDACCDDADCPQGQTCVSGTCGGCPQGQVELANGSCALACTSTAQCALAGGAGCFCSVSDAGNICTTTAGSQGMCPSGSSAQCPPDLACAGGICQPLCGVGPG